MGHINMDTFRLYEALEAGSIPVTLKSAPHLNAQPSYWHCIFAGLGEIPFVVAENWNDALLKVKLLLESDRLDETGRACTEFWNTAKQAWGARMTVELENFLAANNATADD
jgi:hypothetical protein